MGVSVEGWGGGGQWVLVWEGWGGGGQWVLVCRAGVGRTVGASV